MKNIFLLLTISLAFTFNSFSQDLSQPKGGGTLDIVLISPGDGHSVINFEGQISGYGSVFVKFKVSSINTSKTSCQLRLSIHLEHLVLKCHIVRFSLYQYQSTNTVYQQYGLQKQLLF